VKRKTAKAWCECDQTPCEHERASGSAEKGRSVALQCVLPDLPTGADATGKPGAAKAGQPRKIQLLSLCTLVIYDNWVRLSDRPCFMLLLTIVCWR